MNLKICERAARQKFKPKFKPRQEQFMGPRQYRASDSFARLQHFSGTRVQQEKRRHGKRRRQEKSISRGLKMRKYIALAALLLPLALAGCSHHTTVVYAAPPPPPPEFSSIAQQGFHDGIEAARRDINQGKPPDVRRHPRFRNPPVPPPAIEDYRHGFRAGYDQTFRNGPPGPGY
jgi:hypothetical protein